MQQLNAEEAYYHDRSDDVGVVGAGFSGVRRAKDVAVDIYTDGNGIIKEGEGDKQTAVDITAFCVFLCPLDAPEVGEVDDNNNLSDVAVTCQMMKK